MRNPSIKHVIEIKNEILAGSATPPNNASTPTQKTKLPVNSISIVNNVCMIVLSIVTILYHNK